MVYVLCVLYLGYRKGRLGSVPCNIPMNLCIHSNSFLAGEGNIFALYYRICIILLNMPKKNAFFFFNVFLFLIPLKTKNNRNKRKSSGQEYWNFCDDEG